MLMGTMQSRGILLSFDQTSADRRAFAFVYLSVVTFCGDCAGLFYCFGRIEVVEWSFYAAFADLGV